MPADVLTLLLKVTAPPVIVKLFNAVVPTTPPKVTGPVPAARIRPCTPALVAFTVLFKLIKLFVVVNVMGLAANITASEMVMPVAAVILFPRETAPVPAFSVKEPADELMAPDTVNVFEFVTEILFVVLTVLFAFTNPPVIVKLFNAVVPTAAAKVTVPVPAASVRPCVPATKASTVLLNVIAALVVVNVSVPVKLIASPKLIAPVVVILPATDARPVVPDIVKLVNGVILPMTLFNAIAPVPLVNVRASAPLTTLPNVIALFVVVNVIGVDVNVIG